jgi:phosphatidylethanolamine/phosphatidyl-N-methylethanolamine N-methyltransferase
MASNQNEIQFFRGFLANPMAVGALTPSNRHLAAAVAAQIPAGAAGPVLELGAGTGSVTQAIIDRGIAPARVVAVETDPAFAGMLRGRFACSPILEGDAFAFEALLQAARIEGKFDAIVSGLPVIGHSEAQRTALLRMALARLKPGRPFIQFSYAFWPPYPPAPDIAVRHAPTFWRNFPPMNIWVHTA